MSEHSASTTASHLDSQNISFSAAGSSRPCRCRTTVRTRRACSDTARFSRQNTRNHGWTRQSKLHWLSQVNQSLLRRCVSLTRGKGSIIIKSSPADNPQHHSGCLLHHTDILVADKDRNGCENIEVGWGWIDSDYRVLSHLGLRPRSTKPCNLQRSSQIYYSSSSIFSKPVTKQSSRDILGIIFP